MTPPVNRPVFVSFAAGDSGVWRIDRMDAILGEGLPPAASLEIVESVTFPARTFGTWTLRGVNSNTRYATQAEVESLKSRQEGLGRPQSTRAALIPICKSPAWWALAQDERRAIFEEQSHHNAIGMEYLPQIARRLHHSRELGEPFDFLTWFEYAPEDEASFDELVRRLRSSPEWRYVEREVDIRLSRQDNPTAATNSSN
jgi:hypothetical protein